MNKLSTKLVAWGLCISAFAMITSCEKNSSKTTAQEEQNLVPDMVLKTNATGPVDGAGWVQEALTYSIHKPWNLNLSDRYSYNSTYNEHTFWIYPGDAPFQQGSTTSPRCEMRINNDYTTGDHQFEADYKVYSPSNHPVVMQVFGGNPDATAFNMKAYDLSGGAFKHYDDVSTPPLATGIYDTWVHVNIIHKTSTGKVRVYINGVFEREYNDHGAANHYFKCGVYTTSSSPSKVKIKHIKIYKR